MTYRERKQRRVERREEWAESRDRKAQAGFDKASRIAEQIPLGQPILVGHHSEGRARRDQARIHAGMRQGVESADMADHHRTVAAGIEHQLATSIYSDDPDAIEALQARLAGLEAQRERIKAYNATCRKGTPDLALLDDDQRAGLAMALKFQAYACRDGAFPTYALSNLSGNIKRQRDRLAQLEVNPCGSP